MAKKVLVVVGSRTTEDMYGRVSGNRVRDALERMGLEAETLHASAGLKLMSRLVSSPPDLIVPVGFGTPCEDGHVCAVARMAGVPCAGPTPAAGGLMQDKSALSRIVDALFESGSGIRSPRGCSLTLDLSHGEINARVMILKTPLVVKPSFSGSSDGLCVAETHEEAIMAAVGMMALEGKVLVQELEHPIAHEISCTVLDLPDGASFLPIVEIRRGNEAVFGVEEKFGVEALGRHIIPDRLAIPMRSRVREAVMALHDALGPSGLTRTDILVLKSGEIVILEVNGIPGLLESSIACDSARAAGMSFDELCLAYADSAYVARAEPRVWGHAS